MDGSVFLVKYCHMTEFKKKKKKKKKKTPKFCHSQKHLFTGDSGFESLGLWCIYILVAIILTISKKEKEKRYITYALNGYWLSGNLGD